MEFTGKTIAEATSLALETLGISEEEAEIEIKEQPAKGLFGRLKGKAVIEVTAKKQTVKEVLAEASTEAASEDKTVEFVAKVLGYLGIEATAERKEESDKTIITFSSETSSSAIGRRGEVLDAIQTLAGAMENIGKKNYRKVVVDCENYRGKREDTLIKLAHKLEEKATEMRREVILEPMSPFERRIIHMALADSATVTTRSDGKEPNRYVVIVPNDKDEFSHPYNAGRNVRKGDAGRRNNRGGKGGNGGRSYENRGGTRKPSKKSSATLFGTYLGNSLKDKDKE